MPVYRDADGNIIEEKSKPTDLTEKPLPPAPTRRGQGAGAGGTNEPTMPGGQAAPTRRGQGAGAGRLEEPTKPMGQTEPRTGVRAPGGGGKEERGAERERGKPEEHTRINIGDRRPDDKQETAGKADGMDDPVVGWLAVVEGPGKGRALQLGYGSNPIGRGRTARVSLDFGDNQISRGEHAIVTYDPRGRKFFVQHGGGTNLTYLDDQPVLIPTELPAQSHIVIGNTVLRFIPLCGDAFDWQDTEESAKD